MATTDPLLPPPPRVFTAPLYRYSPNEFVPGPPSPVDKGYHYTVVRVGTSTPPQLQSVIIQATGDTTSFYCHDECTLRNCGVHHYPYFHEQNSSTFVVDRSVRYNVSRTDLQRGGSVWGYHARDVLQFGFFFDDDKADDGFAVEDASTTIRSGGSDTAPLPILDYNATFQCLTKGTDNYLNQPPNGYVNLNRFNGLWRDAWIKGAVDEPNLSFCFLPTTTAATTGSSNDSYYYYDKDPLGKDPLDGLLTIGGSQPSLHDTPMVFAQAIAPQSHLEARIRRLFLKRPPQSVSSMVTQPQLRQQQSQSLLLLEEQRFQVNPRASMKYEDLDGWLAGDMAVAFLNGFQEFTGMEWAFDYGVPVRVADATTLGISTNLDDIFPTLVFQFVGIEGWNGRDDDTATSSSPMLVQNNRPWITDYAEYASSSDYPLDVVLEIPPSRLLDLYLNETTGDVYLTSKIRVTPDGRFSSTNLGPNLLRGYDLQLNQGTKHVGFARSDCDIGRVIAAAAATPEETTTQAPTVVSMTSRLTPPPPPPPTATPASPPTTEDGRPPSKENAPSLAPGMVDPPEKPSSSSTSLPLNPEIMETPIISSAAGGGAHPSLYRIEGMMTMATPSVYLLQTLLLALLLSLK